jgi:hypothetical protein
MGCGKTFYINHLDHTKYTLLDGDVILEKHRVPNKNMYWYDDKYHAERDKILDVFNYYINLGCWIFYSGNPHYIKTDIIVLPDTVKRWQQLQNRSGYKPTRERFDLEQHVYANAQHLTTIYINGDIPPYKMLEAIYETYF